MTSFEMREPSLLPSLATSTRARQATNRHSIRRSWIGGCERCQAELVSICERSGFNPNIAFVTDDMVVMQSLVAAGMGVTILPGLALQADRSPAVHTTKLRGFPRQIYSATYGEPPDPPATTALIQAIRDSV
jgi:DNA-binding transcriptional LysR family regulator